jgi:hypothetical protein
MNSILTNLVPLLTAIGLGGLLGAYFQARFQRRAQIGEHEHELKQKRYSCILIQDLWGKRVSAEESLQIIALLSKTENVTASALC